MSIKIVQPGEAAIQAAPEYDMPPTPEEIAAYEKQQNVKQATVQAEYDAWDPKAPLGDIDAENIPENEDDSEQESGERSEVQEEEIKEEPKTPQQKRFAQLREQNEKLERENAENQRLLQQYQQYLLSQEQQQEQQYQQPQQQYQQPPQEAPKFNVKDDEYTEWKDVKGYTDHRFNELAKQNALLQQRLAKQEADQQAAAAESRLLAQHPDFYKVASIENCAKLRKLYPEVAEGLVRTQDSYLQAKNTYTLLKSLGIVEEESRTAQENAQKLEANKKRPRSSASVAPQHDVSPLSQANRFAAGPSEDTQAALYREMLQYAKNA